MDRSAHMGFCWRGSRAGVPDANRRLFIRAPVAVMDHEMFVRRTKAALQAKSEGRADDAVVELRAVVAELESAVTLGANEWHQQQALGLLVDALDAAGRRDECNDTWNSLIAMTQGASTYWNNALASARQDYARWSERASGSGTS